MKEIDQRVTKGILKPGSKLPSIRQLSNEFSCSRNTVIKAYEQLEKKHLIYAVPKSGYYIVDRYQPSKKKSIKPIIIDFFSAGPDKKIMPFRDFQHCMNQAIDIYKEEMFSYSEIQGMKSLREQLAKHLQDLQVFTSAERICVVTGSQQALNLFVSLPFPNGKNNICLEQPTHHAFIESIQVHNPTVYGIKVTNKGIDLEQLEYLFKEKDIKFFYIVSRFHNPTGYSYTNSEKKKIVELSQKYDVYIVEDDYMGDLDINSKRDPMFAFDPTGRVIYTKSFSKVLLPGLRLGITVIPETMIETFLRAKYADDLHTPLLTQGALEIYMKSGMYDAHIKKMRTIYHKKGKVLQEAFSEHLPDNTYSCSHSGFYSTVEIPSHVKSKKLVEELGKENVLVQDASIMYLPQYKKENVIRLSVSQVEEKYINMGIGKIAKAIKEIRQTVR
ncbi:PLP-dependent aminotransferase family protein [Bacillus sp. FJAT-49711]|uniref:aminotransferase-like domain-containing protein n=1 Tax=Bacillus sp. FJAT-49711 TaxID=2833585 RepID=UPI0020164ED2|nr:PLP-dependent aminotransferase family protein [Bacillus sp. FJAT-49711]